MSDGAVIPLVGKTGTGDNRVKVVGPGGRLVESRVTNRTAAFVFMIDDRFLDLQPALKQLMDH